jgi:hypothetical protein
MTTLERPSLRIPFLFRGALDDVDFMARMQGGDLSPTGRHDTGDLEISEWRSDSPEGAILFTRDRRSPELGCVFVSGPNRVDLALEQFTVIPYVPCKVLHLLARGGTDRRLRITALQVLSQTYILEEGASFWDHDITETTRLLVRDSDPSLRREALAVEMLGNPKAAQRDLQALLAAEADASERVQLGLLRKILDTSAHSVPAAPRSGPPAPLRYTIPFDVDSPMDDILGRFATSCTITQRTRLPMDGAPELAELRANEVDGTVILVTTGLSQMGCAFFSGEAAPLMVFGFIDGLAYLPPELAKAGAAKSRSPEMRARCIHALALAETGRIVPSEGIDPDVPSIMKNALSDPDPAVRSAAATANMLLRDELARNNK